MGGGNSSGGDRGMGNILTPPFTPVVLNASADEEVKSRAKQVQVQSLQDFVELCDTEKSACTNCAASSCPHVAQFQMS